MLFKVKLPGSLLDGYEIIDIDADRAQVMHQFGVLAFYDGCNELLISYARDTWFGVCAAHLEWQRILGVKEVPMSGTIDQPTTAYWQAQDGTVIVEGAGRGSVGFGSSDDDMHGLG